MPGYGRRWCHADCYDRQREAAGGADAGPAAPAVAGGTPVIGTLALLRATEPAVLRTPGEGRARTFVPNDGRPAFDVPLTATIAEIVGPAVPVIEVARAGRSVCREVTTCNHVHAATCPDDCPHTHADVIDDDDYLAGAGGGADCTPVNRDAGAGAGPSVAADVDRGSASGRADGDDAAGLGFVVAATGEQGDQQQGDAHRPSVGCGVWLVKEDGNVVISCGTPQPFIMANGARLVLSADAVALCCQCLAREAVPAALPPDQGLTVCARCRHLRVDGERCQVCITQERAERLAVRALERYEREWTELAERLRGRLDGLGLDRSAIWKEFWRAMAEARLLAGEQRQDVLNERERAGDALADVSDRTAARS